MEEFKNILKKPNNVELIRTFTNHPSHWLNVKKLCKLNNKPCHSGTYRANLIQLHQENVLKKKQVSQSGRAHPEFRYKLNRKSDKPRKLLEKIESRASDSK